MTIYYQPDSDTDPDKIDVWHVADDGTQTDIGPADVSDVSGMPDSVGGIAPDAVQTVAVSYARENLNVGNGNSPVASALSLDVMLDILDNNFILGSPP